jgi:hypothetical protein
MSDNAFDTVRKIRHLPGLKLAATIDPTQISKRVKTAAQKMLRTGILTAGYRSKSRLLAEQLLNDAGRVAPVSANSWGVFISDAAILTKEAREQIVELVNAARLLEHASTTSGNSEYINERYDEMAKQVERTKIGKLHMHMYQPVIHQQIAEIVSACCTPLMVEIHNELANKLDTTEPFHINF